MEKKYSNKPEPARIRFIQRIPSEQFARTATACIAKGKAGKPYEFGSKVVFVRGAKSGVITAECNFSSNPYDGKTLEDTLAQSERLCNGYRAKVAVTDRGFRGQSKVVDKQIVIPDSPANIKQRTAYRKRKACKSFIRRIPSQRDALGMGRVRAGIEPIIGHLKHDHRMVRNFLIRGILLEKERWVMITIHYWQR